jgi:transcriptional regulator with XRE-family HTH domain
MASHSDQQRPGQTVGSKLRAARSARKMTQSQLAQPDFSVSYVSAIERDQIQPSLRALEIFAQRLGTTSTDLLSKTTGYMKPGHSEKDTAHETKQEIELDLLEAQLLLLQGDSHKAMELLRSLSSDSLKSHQEIRQCYLLGVALYDAGLLPESESVLTQAYTKATLENDYFARRIRDMLGLVYVSMHNHSQGFEYQLRNIDQLEKGKPPRDAFFDAQVYANLGLHYQDLNKIDDAIEMFHYSLAQTNELLSPEQLTMMYWNMSTSFAETQQYFLSMLFAYKALQLLVQQYDYAMRTEIYHYLGQAILQQDEQDALLTLQQFMQDASSQNDTLALATITATTAELLFRQGEQNKAFEYAQRACELALAQRESIITASIFLTCGNIAYAQGNYQVGDAQFLTGLDMLERLKKYREYADKCALYAQLLEERGLSNEALKYYKIAYTSGLEFA